MFKLGQGGDEGGIQATHGVGRYEKASKCVNDDFLLFDFEYFPQMVFKIIRKFHK